MNSLAFSLIAACLIGVVIKAVLPKGKQSPFYAPLNFLLSLILLLMLTSPFIKLLHGNSFPIVFESEMDFETDAVQSAGQIIAEKNQLAMEKAVRSAFPEADFSLRLETDENYVPKSIRLACDDEKTRQEISRFLQKNYGIITTPENTKGNESE